MNEKIKLVKGDTGPTLYLSLTNEQTGAVIDLTGASLVFRFGPAGDSTIKETLAMGLATGIVLEDGSVSTAPPYNVAGAGGRCFIQWSPTALDTEGEFEGEVEITFPDGTIQTVYDIFRLKVRAAR